MENCDEPEYIDDNIKEHGYPLICIDGFLRAMDACGLRYLKFKLSGKLTKIMPRRGDKDEISLPIKIFEEYVKAVQTNIFENFEIYCLFEESEEMEHVSRLGRRMLALKKEKLQTNELEELLNELCEKIEIKFTDYYLIGSVKENNFLIALHQ